MIGFVMNLALCAADQAVQSTKLVHGFVQGGAENIYGFAHDRAEEVLGMLEHAAETTKACTVKSVQKVQDFAQGGAQAILGMVEHATKTAKTWMASVVTAWSSLWKVHSEKDLYQAQPEEDLYLGFSGAALMAMAMPDGDMEYARYRNAD